MKNYMILDAELLDHSLVNSAVNSSIESVRHNEDSTKMVVKFSHTVPDLFMGHRVYTKSEILKILEGSEWQYNPLD